VHWVDAGIDTGTVITQKEVVVLAQDDEASLHERIKIVERELIVETLQSFIADGLPRRSQ
jgi:phosphoribosylglycinamide formyltransferase-1